MGKRPLDLAGVEVVFLAVGAAAGAGVATEVTGVRPPVGTILVSMPPSETALGPFLGPMQPTTEKERIERTNRLRTMAVELG